VEVGVRQPQYLRAAAAHAARLVARLLAQHQLSEPERETLLADTRGAGQEQHLR
jgi:hypothetical protein